MKLLIDIFCCLTRRISLGLMLLVSSPMAWSGSCVESEMNSYSCSSVSNIATDTTQSITADPSDDSISVTTTSGFGIYVPNNRDDGDAFNLNAGSGIEFTDTNSSQITGARDGIQVTNSGTGAVTLSTTGWVNAQGDDAIDILHQGTGDITITTDGELTARDDGLAVVHEGTGIITLNVNGAVNTKDDDGIDLDRDASGDIAIVTQGVISAFDRGISVTHHGATGDITLQALNEISAGADGINVITDVADVTVSLTVAATVATGFNLENTTTFQAIDLTGVTGNAQLELQSGYSFGGIIDARNGATDNRLVFGGSGTANFNLSELDDGDDSLEDDERFFGFATIFLKQGAGAFLFTGNNAEAFTQAQTTAGLALLNGAELTLADDIAFQVNSNAGFGAIGANNILNGNATVQGSVVLSNGNMVLTDVVDLDDPNDTLTINGNYISNNGVLYVDTEINDGVTQNSDQLVIAGDTSGTTQVVITNNSGLGGRTGQAENDGIEIISVSGNSTGTFQISEPLEVGAFEYDLVQANSQDWALQSTRLTDQAIVVAYLPWTFRSFGQAVFNSYQQRKRSIINTSKVDYAKKYGKKPATNDEIDEKSLVKPYRFWTRYTNNWSDIDAVLLDDFAQVSYKENFSLLQTGIDIELTKDLIISGFVHYGLIDIDSIDETNSAFAGVMDNDSFGGGLAVATTRGKFYSEMMLAHTGYNIAVATPNGTTDYTKNADAWMLFNELGWQFISKDTLTLTSRLRFTYQSIGINRFVDKTTGANIFFDHTNSFLSQLNTVVSWWPASGIQIYSGIGLAYESLSDPTVEISGTTLSLNLEPDSYELDAGIKWFNRSNSASLSLGATYRTTKSDINTIQTRNARAAFLMRF